MDPEDIFFMTLSIGEGGDLIGMYLWKDAMNLMAVAFTVINILPYCNMKLKMYLALMF